MDEKIAPKILKGIVIASKLKISGKVDSSKSECSGNNVFHVKLKVFSEIMLWILSSIYHLVPKIC